MKNFPLGRPLRFALFGGGPDSFIGKVHVTAACLDNRAVITAGCFSTDFQKSLSVAPDYGVLRDRVYPTVEEFIAGEAKLSAIDRIDFIIVATPNHAHFPICKAALEAGINVVCDKPMTVSLEEAETLAKLVETSGAVFGLTHNYSGYPLVRQARAMILGGELGKIRSVRASYIQGWLCTDLESTGQKQAEWRTDPKRSGAAGCFGDIGTHAYHLGRYMTGLAPAEISARLTTFVPGRRLDDFGTAVITYESGAVGTVTASQISHGRENDLRIEIDGTKGSIEWRQEEPNKMWVRRNGSPHQLYTRDPNAPFMADAAKAGCRLPSGHPEAFFEAFANLYGDVLDDVVKRQAGKSVSANPLYPNVNDGVEGVYFIQQAVASSRSRGKCMPLRHSSARD